MDLSNGFAEALREELDLRIEAQNMTAVRVAAAAGGVNGSVRIPQPHQPLCTMNVLVMERLDGRALGTIMPSEEIGDRQGLARTLLDTLLREVMIEGVFHADPHPGNVLLLADGQLGLLDFDSVGRVDAGLRAALQRLLLAAPGFDILAEARRFTTEQLAVERGRLGINVRLLADVGDRRYLTALAHQFILTFLAATLGLMAVLMLGLHGGPTVTHRVTLYAFIGYCLLVFAGFWRCACWSSCSAPAQTDPASRARVIVQVAIAASIFLDILNVFLFLLELFGGNHDKREPPLDPAPDQLSAVTVILAAAAQHLPGALHSLEPTLDHYGYLAVAGLVLVEDFGVPVPGETVLILGAVYAGTGRLNIVVVALLGFCGAVLGDNAGFAIGHFGGRRLAARYGRYIFLTPERLDKATGFFDRHGGKVIVIARFIEGLRQANGIIAGTTGMAWQRFLFFNAIGAALWVGVWTTIGYVSGSHINTIYDDATRYDTYIAAGLAVALIAYIARRLARRRRARAASGTRDSSP